MTPIKHGHTLNMVRTSEYCAWDSMKQRCHNPRNEKYNRYGGRGIFVCERWFNSFQNFISDMGLKPSSDHTLERLHNDKGYSPDNCVWATMEVQSLNKRSSLMLTAKGKTQTLHEWAVEIGMSQKTLWNRVKRKSWEINRALFTPVDTRCRNGNARIA